MVSPGRQDQEDFLVQEVTEVLMDRQDLQDLMEDLVNQDLKGYLESKESLDSQEEKDFLHAERKEIQDYLGAPDFKVSQVFPDEMEIPDKMVCQESRETLVPLDFLVCPDHRD